MTRFIPINEEGTLAVPSYLIIEALCKECGLPKDLRYWEVDCEKGKVYRWANVYHNGTEEVVYTTDEEKVKLAHAIKTIIEHIDKNGQ